MEKDNKINSEIEKEKIVSEKTGETNNNTAMEIEKTDKPELDEEAKRARAEKLRDVLLMLDEKAEMRQMEKMERCIVF
jgi:hypothetical protein